MVSRGPSAPQNPVSRAILAPGFLIFTVTAACPRGSWVGSGWKVHLTTACQVSQSPCYHSEAELICWGHMGEHTRLGSQTDPTAHALTMYLVHRPHAPGIDLQEHPQAC